MQVVAEANLSDAAMLKAFSAMLEKKQYNKMKTGHSYGISPKMYVRVKTILPNFDADKNQSYKNDEVTAALESLRGGSGIMLPGGKQTTLTLQQQAVMWQLITGSRSAKNNPFSPSIGQQVINALAAMNTDKVPLKKLDLPK